jgi:hypothetical protein
MTLLNSAATLGTTAAPLHLEGEHWTQAKNSVAQVFYRMSFTACQANPNATGIVRLYLDGDKVDDVSFGAGAHEMTGGPFAVVGFTSKSVDHVFTAAGVSDCAGSSLTHVDVYVVQAV